jgi:eukaryotic-like serine/threonine-protein kinase
MINNRFKIIRKIGEGRSSVYKCTDLRSEYYYALKITSPSMPDEEFNKFADEYYTIQKLNHPGIIKAYESGTVFESSREDVAAGSRYILLEYFDGVELSEMDSIPENQLREIIIQTASVLQYLHQSYYIYYDLKPENILVSQADGKLLIKVIDFGFARITNGEEKTTRGTAEYIAPELLKNETA